MSIRVVIADDADVVVMGAQRVLEDDHRFAVVGTARCIDDLLDSVSLTRPDAVLMGEYLHSLDILNAVEQVRNLRPKVKIIVMGGLVDGLLIRDLFNWGVDGYLYKSDDLCELLPTAIHTVLLNRPYLSPTANSEYLIAMRSPQPGTELDRESREVLQRLGRGEHAAEIAYRMGIDKRRVYWIRSKLRRRFNAKTNEHLIQRACGEGFIYPQ